MTTPCEIDEDTSAKLLRQVEFYFSDSNLPRDRFLLKTIEECEDDGLVSLALVCSFSRMRSHLGLKELGEDKVPPETVSAVAEILRKSSQLRVSEDGLKVGRTKKLLNPKEVQEEVDARSIAASPLPWNITMDQVESFFSQFAKVSSVRLPRYPGSKTFCGVAIIELSSEEEAHKVLERKLVFECAELELQHKKEFDKALQTELSSENEVCKSNFVGKSSMGGYKNDRMRTEHEQDFPKGVVVSFKLEKVSSTVDDKEDKSNAVVVFADEKPLEANKEVSDVEDILTREDIKDVLNKYGNIKFINFSRGDTSGYVRFELPDGAKKARAAAVLASEGGLVIKSFLINLEAVEGVAENAYWKKLREGQNRRHESGGRGFDSHCRGRSQYGFGGYRGRGRGRGHSGSEEQVGGDSLTLPHGKHTRLEEDDDSGVPSKVSRTD